MADEFSDPVLVQKLIRAAKEEPVSFSFVQASSPDKSLLGVDKHKHGEQIFAVLKKQAGSSKGCFGTVRLDGNEAVFSAEKPISGLEKQLTDWFRRNKISLKPVLAAGGETQEEERDEAREESPQAPETRKAEAPKADLHEQEGGEEEGEEDLEDETDKIFTQPYIRAMLKRSRNAPVQFAFGRGAKPEDDLLTMHPRKAAPQLVQLVKRANGAAQGSFGTAQWDGQEVVFTCEKTPISGLKKRIRRIFKEWKLSLKPVIFGPEGRFDEEGDEEDEVEGVETAGEDAGPAEALAALAAELKELLPHLQDLVRANPSLTDEMRAAYRDCDGAIKSSDLAGAREALARLRELGGAGETKPEGQEGNPDIERMRGQLANAKPRLDQIIERIPDRKEDIDRELAAFEAAAGRGDVAAAREALFELAALAKAPVDAREEIGDQMQSLDIAFRKSRIEWNQIRGRVHDQILSFQQALRAELKDEEDFAEIDDEISKLDSILVALDGALEDKLDEAMSASDVTEKERLKKAAHELVKSYIDYVQQNPHIALLDGNEFMPLSVNALLTKHLGQLEASLA